MRRLVKTILSFVTAMYFPLVHTPPTDLAGPVSATPNPWQIRSRVSHLITQYLPFSHLNDRLKDLPAQFLSPQMRQWRPVNWELIHRKQIIGLDPDIFLSILLGAMETEAPIRGYTQTSRQYLAPIHPMMAQYVGGQVTPDGTLIEPGLWEKEERQHTPALLRIYHLITGRKAELEYRAVRDYYPTGNPEADLYRHGLHRIATEYSAVCLYLWMMAHTTGPLQAVLAELLQDEINHMTKFWGFGLWLFPETHWARTAHILSLIVPNQLSSASPHRLGHTIMRMMGVLHWSQWQRHHQAELAMTFITVLGQLHRWSDRLSREFLNDLLGPSPIQPR